MSLITYLTMIHFDHGALRLLPEELNRLGVAKPLVVTDPGVVAAGLLETLRGALPPEPRHPTMFLGTPANPTEDAVEAALAMYREGECDGIIAFGGGSPIDLAKGVALLATHSGPLAQYATIEGGTAKITAAVAPVVAIPTTAGTGSEVGRAALITLRDRRKLGFISPHLIPKSAICDPDLTLRLPSRITAATGMDALAHCVETYLSPRVNPPAEAIALDGAGRVMRFLERAVANGSDREARWEMMMAALEGGLTFQKGLGAVHAMSHALGGLEPSLHHGTLNAVLLPHVLRFNDGHVGDKYHRLRAALGLEPDADLPGAFAELNSRLGLPTTLGEMGVTAKLLSRAAEGAVADHSTATNPRPASAANYRAMLQAAMG